MEMEASRLEDGEPLGVSRGDDLVEADESTLRSRGERDKSGIASIGVMAVSVGEKAGVSGSAPKTSNRDDRSRLARQPMKI